MKLNFAIPILPYICFELVKVNIEDYAKQNFVAISIDTIYLVTFPESFDSRLRSRDAITQTDSEVFLNKYDYTPQRISLSGTFGVKRRMLMTGWDRLKQFEQQIIKRSKTASLPDGDQERFIYAVNYYNFLMGQFGNINVSSWATRGNARTNSDLINYNFEFDIIGKLVKTDSMDPILLTLNTMFGDDGLIAGALSYVNDGEIAGKITQALVSIGQFGSATGISMGAFGSEAGVVGGIF